MVFIKKSKEPELSPQDMMKQIAAGLKKQSQSPNMHAYQPHRKQNIFHQMIDKKVRLYIGGNRAGKSVCGVIEDLWWATGRHPYFNVPTPCFGRVVSVDFVNGIEKIIIPIFKRWVIESDLRGGTWEQAYDKQERTLHFTNGSFIEFMSYDQDLDKFAGTSRHFIHFDEEPPKHIYTENLLRTVDVSGNIWITMTPIDGMTWVYDDLWEKGKDNEDPSIGVVEVAIHENPYLDANSIEVILAMLDPDERLAREKGQFVQLGGLVYKQFDKEKHVFESDPADPWLPPKDWEIIVSLDHGLTNPTAVLWHGISPEGDIVTFYEHYLSGWTIDLHAAHIHSVNKKLKITPDIYIGDPSIRNKQPISGTSIWEEYAKYGIAFLLGNNDVSAGIIRTAKYLRVAGSNGLPKLRVASCCVNTIHEFGRYRWKTYANKQLNFTNNPNESPHKKDDHACFIAGTLVQTSVGEIPIEQIKVGDLVWTREGLKEVELSGSVGYRQVYSLISEDNKVTATGDHLFWTDSWKRLDSLRYSDMISIWQTLSDSKALTTDVIPTLQITQKELIIQQGPEIESKKVVRGSIKTCGLTLTDRFQRATKSIIKTVTLLITQSKTWNVLVQKNMMNSIEEEELVKYENSEKLSYRTVVTTVENGINQRLTDQKEILSVPITVKHILDETAELITKDENVNGVETCSSLTSMSLPLIVQSRVVSVTENLEKQEVFNLKVKDCPEYFANGFLVHNCDSLRYMIMSRPDLKADLVEVQSGAPKPEGLDASVGNDPYSNLTVPKILVTVPRYNADSEYDLNGWETDEMGAGW